MPSVRILPKVRETLTQCQEISRLNNLELATSNTKNIIAQPHKDTAAGTRADITGSRHDSIGEDSLAPTSPVSENGTKDEAATRVAEVRWSKQQVIYHVEVISGFARSGWRYALQNLRMVVSVSSLTFWRFTSTNQFQTMCLEYVILLVLHRHPATNAYQFW